MSFHYLRRQAVPILDGHGEGESFLVRSGVGRVVATALFFSGGSVFSVWSREEFVIDCNLCCVEFVESGKSGFLSSVLEGLPS